jgi:hypothetical protein
MPFTPGRDTGNFPHIGLKAMNEKIDDPLKPYLTSVRDKVGSKKGAKQVTWRY